MANLYWSIYKNLEYEVLSLAKLIHFDDNQLSVYSVRIADLLIRCAVEIEAISKDLYEKNGGNMVDDDGKEKQLLFDADCLNFLEDKWRLGKKQICIISMDSYFENEENKVLTPLHKANIRGKCDWKKAYQAVKHNRSKNLQKASIKHLLRALAALYLLNIYNKADSPILLGKTQKLSDLTFGSKIFTATSTSYTSEFPYKEIILDDNALSATYIIKQTNESYRNYYDEVKMGFDKQKNILFTSGYERRTNEDEGYEDIEYSELYRIAAEFGGSDLVQKVSNAETKSKAVNFLQYEAVLNKNPVIRFTP